MLYSTVRQTLPSPNDGLENLVKQFLCHPIGEAIINAIAEKVIQVITPQLIQLQEQEKPRYYTRNELSAILHLTLPTISRLIKDGIIQAKKAGARVLIPADAIDKALAEGKVFQYKRKKK